MTTMSAPNRGDIGGVAGGSEPVVNGGPDLAALDRRLAGSVMAGDQQHQPVARGNCSLEPGIDCAPRGIEVHAVEVENPVRRDLALAQALVPAAVERFPERRAGRRSRRLRANLNRFQTRLRLAALFRFFNSFWR